VQCFGGESATGRHPDQQCRDLSLARPPISTIAAYSTRCSPANDVHHSACRFDCSLNWLPRRSGKHIVNLSSMGRGRRARRWRGYGSTKASLEAMARPGPSRDGASRRARQRESAALGPVYTRQPSGANSSPRSETPPDAPASQPEEIAAVIAFLASPTSELHHRRHPSSAAVA